MQPVLQHVVNNAIDTYGPYGIMPAENGNWLLVYFEDEDDDCGQAWADMIAANPQFGKSHQIDTQILEVADRRVVVELWGQPASPRLVVGG